MSVAIPIPLLQHLPDVNVTPAVGVDEYALVYDHDTARFVLRAMSAGVTDHGALTGLSDDDHAQYLLATGARTGASAAAQAFTLGVVSPFSAPAADSTTAWQVRKADKATAVATVDTTNARVGIGTSAPAYKLHVDSAAPIVGITSSDAASYAILRAFNSANNYVQMSITGPSYVNPSKAIFSSAGVPLKIATNGSVATGGLDNLSFQTGGYENIDSMTITAGSPGLVGIGTASPATTLHAVSTTAVTNDLRNVLTLGANVTGAGVGAAGLGPAVLFQAESTTTVGTTQAAIEASWIVATHATRTSRLALKAYDTAEREGIRIDASGTAALLGFYGHAAAAQPSAYTPSNVSADRAFDADTVLVAELADVVGTLIADLQSIGLLA